MKSMGYGALVQDLLSLRRGAGGWFGASGGSICAKMKSAGLLLLGHPLCSNIPAGGAAINLISRAGLSLHPAALSGGRKMEARMTPEQVQTFFTRSDGSYLFARWGRPIVPVVFGVEDATLRVVKGAIEAVVTLAGHKMAETDPELGANLMVFFFRDWAELPQVPNLERLVPDLAPLVRAAGSGGGQSVSVFPL